MNKEGLPSPNKEILTDPDLEGMLLAYERLVGPVAQNNPELEQDRIHLGTTIEKKITAIEVTAQYYRNLFESKKPKKG